MTKRTPSTIQFMCTSELESEPRPEPERKKKTPPRARHATTSSIISTSTTTTATISSNVLDRIPQVQVRVQVREPQCNALNVLNLLANE